MITAEQSTFSSAPAQSEKPQVSHRSLKIIAKEAMKKLYVPKMGMFRSHLGENRCDSADGPGLLLLSLMYLEGDDPTLKSSLQF